MTGDDRVHRAYAFELSTRDLARFGLLFLNDGSWNGRQIVPREWVRESTTSFSDHGLYHGERLKFVRDESGAATRVVAAEGLARVQQRLRPRGLGLLVHDVYRPWHVTKMFWDATPESMRDFVANPANGSRHNRGAAVDLTLCELDSGKPIPMVAGYVEFSSRSFPAYPGGTSRQRWYRDQLRREMEAEGFSVYEYEWWHFDYEDWQKYRIGNEPFEALILD